MLELELDGEASTIAVAEALAGVLRPGDVIGLEGGLGAGKTTFTRGAIHGLGVRPSTAVTSPTFALLHQYRGRLPIAHADLYRLADDSELEELGLDELIEEGAVVFVEWGRKLSGMAERTTLFVDLDIVSDSVRRARFQPRHARGEVIIADLAKRLSR
jgi:tRNA threonylcarbamoyl adenosine modification protein YjeE